MEIDLRTCEEGDILISQHGKILRYVCQLEEGNFYDHKVEYIEDDMGSGSRTHDGYVFRNNRLPSDHNIVRIIKKEDFKNIVKFLSKK